MVFSSSFFLLYFLPIFLLLYYVIPQKFKNTLIVIASILFYSWGGPSYIFIIFFSIFLDFYIAKQIHKSQGSIRKKYLITGLAINLGLLLYFKYANFFVENLNQTLLIFGKTGLDVAKVALPIGISFFTFHEMSYLIDVYRSDKKPMTNIIDYSLYILFFPQLVAGPIIRFNEISDQITNRSSSETFDNRLLGFFRFCIGLAKKVLIANVLGAEASRIFELDPSVMPTGLAWLGAIAYTFQIYFDFAGYSDMAIGLARMLGFKFPENFNNPYNSKSITEFWRRWHMTLSRWMRDYLYIPLGGNRVNSKFRLYFNLWIVFVLSGFWHGATWNFVIWGVYHGFFLAIERLFFEKVLHKMGSFLSVLITFIIVVVGWVFFFTDDIHHSILYLQSMFSFNPFEYVYEFNIEFIVILGIAIFFSFIRLFKIGEILENLTYSEQCSNFKAYVITSLSLIILVISISSITSFGFNPFIYFRF